ncbi:MAG: diacylglycerol kinase family protein, partial [Anaerolineae bacterium]|nr:diacylglycerol kinase family protein [Anaerolineae bacterium]
MGPLFRKMKSPSLLASFKYAWEGIAHAFRTQRNFRIHVVISAAVVAAGLWLRVGGTEWAVLIRNIRLVFLAGLFNPALSEAIVDRCARKVHAWLRSPRTAPRGGLRRR